MARLGDAGGFVELLEGVRTDRQPRRAELAMTDGRYMDCYVASLPASTGADVRAWYFRDITHRKQAERKLRGLAQTLQSTLLPPVAPSVPGLDVAMRYRYAGTGEEVGGDFYDAFQISNAWGVVIGDVCGKGAAAASLTALVRYTARAAAMLDERPSAVLATVNEAVLREPGDDRLCTLAYLKIELGDREHGVRLTAASAGHPLPVIVRASGELETFGIPGMVLGAFEDIAVADTTGTLGSGDAVVLYTDGVTEARSDASFFGVERLHALLAARGASAQAIADLITDTALDFQGGVPRDDIAVVVVRVP